LRNGSTGGNLGHGQKFKKRRTSLCADRKELGKRMTNSSWTAGRVGGNKSTTKKESQGRQGEKQIKTACVWDSRKKEKRSNGDEPTMVNPRGLCAKGEQDAERKLRQPTFRPLELNNNEVKREIKRGGRLWEAIGTEEPWAK